MWKRSLLFLFLIGVLLSIGPARAASGGPYELNWLTIDGGGVTVGSGAASGGDYSMQNTIGQPDPVQSSGGVYTLRGGFWVEGTYHTYLPVTLK